ncbi:MAG: UDP-N-acetylmuramoyl-L-alanine--D-glutamate ligase [Bacteroidota bacterium]
MKSRLITILGAGESGVGAAILAKKLGYYPFVSDSSLIGTVYKDNLVKEGIEFEEGSHQIEKILESELVIKSPGIPPTAPIVESLKKAGKILISEIEWAFSHTDKPIIAITGSNGKSTTTTLIWHLLKNAGIQAKLTGNIGHSLALAVAQNDVEVFVTEVSSFQLEDINKFAPFISLILNITPDHLDRYHYDIQEYAATKCRIFENQKGGSYFLYPDNDKLVCENISALSKDVEKIPLSLDTNSERVLKYENHSYFLHNPSLQGNHNAANALFAIAVSRIFEIPPNNIQKGLDSFKGLPHRMEFLGKIRGISFINDSKATNVDSVYYALQAQNSRIIWIAGGVDKGNDYSELIPLVRQKVKKLVCLGKNNEPLLHAFGEIIPIVEEASSMEIAVNLCMEGAENGDIILLSPACASFDLFNNYMHRGEMFRQEFEKLNPH